jgi:hypothetical protein
MPETPVLVERAATPGELVPFSGSELGVVFIKSFFCALLKKIGLDQVNVLQQRCSLMSAFIIDVLLVMTFAWLCTTLFGYSFLFFLAVESTNHILRRTDHASWTMLASPAFYAPGVVLGWVNNLNRAQHDDLMQRYVAHSMRSGMSGLGGLIGWMLANHFGPRRIDVIDYLKKLYEERIGYKQDEPQIAATHPRRIT